VGGNTQIKSRKVREREKVKEGGRKKV